MRFEILTAVNINFLVPSYVALCSWYIAVSVLEECAACILILVAATLFASFYLFGKLLTSHCRKRHLNALWVDLTCWNGGGLHVWLS